MIVVLAIDALEYEMVEEFNCSILKQDYYGKTNIAEFSQARTMVLWSSFMTGKNKEKDVLTDGDKEMWNKRWDINETFFSHFKNPVVIDLPGYSYDLEAHEKSRELLKRFFNAKDDNEKNNIKKQYNSDAFDHHKKVKKDFIDAIHSAAKEDKESHDFILGYFSAIDVIGHLNFGNKTLMKMLYKDVEEVAKEIKRIEDVKLIILSDHGMKAIGMFGDHSEYGFWSTNFEQLDNPKITDFYKIILGCKDED